MGAVEDFQLSFYEEISKISERNNEAGSEVYLVKDTRDDRLYVKKLLKVSEENVYRTIMSYEMNNPGRGKLVGIPKIFAVVNQEERLVVVEEYINHPTLGKVMEAEALTEVELIHIFREICRVMQQLHTLYPPIIHRDIKPDNIMVDMNAVRGMSAGTKVYVIDWNAAREYSLGKERDTQLMGTIEYAAPEQLGYGQSDVRTDIYGVGATLEYCMREMESKSLAVNGSHIWKQLKNIVKKAKSLSPDDRYSSDQNMIVAFDELLGLRQSGATGFVQENMQTGNSNINGYNQLGYGNGYRYNQSSYGNNGSGSNQSSYKQKCNYTPPGFRTKKLWKMLVAILGYLMIFATARDAQLNDYTGFFNVFSKVTYFILLMCHPLWFCNYLGIQDRFKWTRSESRIIRVLGHILVVAAMWLIWATILAFPEVLGLT